SSTVRIDTYSDCPQAPLTASLFRDFPVNNLSPLLHAIGRESHLHDEDQDVPARLHVLKYFDSIEAQSFLPEDLRQPARAYTRMLIETLLTNSCSLHMIEAPATGSLGLRFTPAALLDALWLQFACAIDGNKDYRQCQECKRWF